MGERVACPTLAGMASLGDSRFDRPFAQRGADVFGVVAAVGEQPVGSFAAAAPQRRDRVDDRDRVAAIVVVGRAQQDGERGAAAVAG